MPRYVAFLRGVSPLNARMPALRQCFEQAGFVDVRTLLSSGNVVFSARPAILKVVGNDVFSASEPSGDGPAFMRLLERTFGADITTRTLATVKRCAAA